jgi:hypothetical protein
MWTLGIDIAKRKHVATLSDDDGKKVFKKFYIYEHYGWSKDAPWKAQRNG